MKTPNQSEFIELSKAYVALSNAHALPLIFQMLAANAAYQSSSVGDFDGKREIEEMMQQFFTRFPDVNWSVNHYHYIETGLVEFDIMMAATDIETGQSIERKGVESIQFDRQGLITNINVSVV